MTLVEYTFLAASSLFVIVDPIAVVPAFLAMTPTDQYPAREQMARFAAATAAGILIVFGFVGQTIFKLLGITLPAFSIAGSIVLLMIALDMLKAQRSRVQETEEETFAGASKADIAITPLAMPMLAGPGAISTTILLKGQAENFGQLLALVGCILGVCFVTYIILRLAARTTRWMSPIAMKLTTRIMGLLLAAVAVQFMVNGLRDLGLIPHL
jgi:multiple antibiotic resistance protein